MNRFNIGDIAFRATAKDEQVWIICPECLGSGRLCVILGDNTEVSIACVCCERGCEGSPGRIHSYAFKAEVEVMEITGIESERRNGEIETSYKIGCYTVDDKDLFKTREEAKVRAVELVAEHEAEEKKRLGYKERQTRTWAWNVAYWRKQIRDAKETIEHATARLNAAPKNVKKADLGLVGASNIPWSSVEGASKNVKEADKVEVSK